MIRPVRAASATRFIRNLVQAIGITGAALLVDFVWRHL